MKPVASMLTDADMPVSAPSVPRARLNRPVPAETLRSAIDATSFKELKRKQSAESDVAGKFFRRGTAAKGIERFSREQRQWVLAHAGRELERCGYARLAEEGLR